MKKIIILIMILSIVFVFTGCRESEKVAYNLSQQADNFNVVRQITVINCIQGDVLFQMTGKISISNETSSELTIIVEDENGNYQKHYIGLSDNVTYVVEQLRFTDVENYKFVINYNPKMWIPVTVGNID